MNPISSSDLSKLTHINQVRFALFCVYQIEDHWKSLPESVKVIETVERWLNGEASKEECRLAAKIAYDVVHSFAHYATYYIANIIYSDYYAVSAANVASNTISASANKIQTIAYQWEYYEELLDIYKVFEDSVLT